LCRNAEKKYEMKLIAGRDGMDNIVRWIHMVEDSEVPDFLHGNELIFTTGIGHIGNEWLIEFVKKLKEHNAVGLCVNLGPYIESVPSKVIVYCEANNFPLFTLPWKVHVIDLTYNFCRRIIDDEKEETTIAQACMNLIFAPDKSEDYVPTLEKYGFRQTSAYTMLAFSAVVNKNKKYTEDDYSNKRLQLKRILKRKSLAAHFMIDDKLIVIYQNMSNNDIKQIVSGLSEFDCSVSFYVGISNRCDGYMGIQECYKESLSALSVSLIKKEQITFYRDIGIYKLLLGIENREVLSSYEEDILGKLIKYDDMNNTDYMNTLKVYLECSGSVQLVAENLGVHRNTINYKMKIIRDILGVELNDEEKMKIFLAFRVREVLGQHRTKNN
jgi:hypothetical protein